MPARRRALAALIVMAGAAVAGCLHAGSPDAVSDGDELTIPGRFSLRAMNGARLLPSSAIDSAAGRIQGDGFVIEYDHGPYSDPLDRIEGDEEYQAKEIMLDSRRARIVTLRSAKRFPGRPYFVGVHFPDIGTTSLGRTRLSVYAATPTPQARAKVERILATIRIR